MYFIYDDLEIIGLFGTQSGSDIYSLGLIAVEPHCWPPDTVKPHEITKEEQDAIDMQLASIAAIIVMCIIGLMIIGTAGSYCFIKMYQNHKQAKKDKIK
jgi:hypothetical protein